MSRLMPIAMLAAACVSRVPVEDREERSTCLDAFTREVRVRVEGEHVLVEEVWGPSVCTGKPGGPPRLLAKLDRSAAPPTCPTGALVMRVWSSGDSIELPDFAATLTRPHLGDLRRALAAFEPREVGGAYLVECKPNGEADWLFVGRDAIGFWSANDLTARQTTNHPRVLFPLHEPPPPVAPEPPHPLVEEPGPDAPDPGPPNVTHEGCPATALVPTWAGRTLIYSAVLPGPDVLERYALRVEAKRATLVLETRKFDRREAPPTWRCASSTTLEGSVQAGAGGKSTLTFGGATLECAQRRLNVAPKKAVRLALPPVAEDCARHRWSVARSVKTKALVCEWVEAGRPPSLSSEPLVFGEGALVLERLMVEGDTCEPYAPDFEAVRAASDGDPAPPTPDANRRPWPGTR